MRGRGSMAPQLLFPKTDITRRYPKRRSTIDRDNRRASTKISWMDHLDQYDISRNNSKQMTALPLLPQYRRRPDRYYSIMWVILHRWTTFCRCAQAYTPKKTWKILIMDQIIKKEDGSIPIIQHCVGDPLVHSVLVYRPQIDTYKHINRDLQEGPISACCCCCCWGLWKIVIVRLRFLISDRFGRLFFIFLCKCIFKITQMQVY